MRGLAPRAIIGILLIALGVLLLLQTTGLVRIGAFGLALVWAALFGIAGLAFLYVFLADRVGGWWAAIPGFTLLGLGLVIALSELGPRGAGTWGGALFMAAISAGFWAIFAVRSDFWWAVIPGGTLLTLAFVILASQATTGEVAGASFFVGLGLTFLLVYYLPTPQGHNRWALIPAVILLAFGFLLGTVTTRFVNYVWPLLLIAIGAYLLLRDRRPRGGT